MSDFAAEWRARHPLSAWGTAWECSLCGKMIQAPEAEFDERERRVTRHLALHGQDWLDLQASLPSIEDVARAFDLGYRPEAP